MAEFEAAAATGGSEVMNPGDRFLHFRIQSFLGRGNFGDVYRAENLREQRQCALKIVRTGDGEEEQVKFEAEVYGAKLQKELADPEDRVVKVFDYGHEEHTQTFFIEMEYIDGEDLAMVIRRPTGLPPIEVARLARDLCGLLEWLAGSEVVHGDLKPRNIRLETATGRIKVLDFGIARALKETMVTMAFNSPAYTSPERLSTGKADCLSDLWAAGVILYELMAGQPPFQAENRELLERRIRSHQPPAPLPAAYPEQLRRLVMRMLRREPGERFGSPAEARKAFEDYLQGIPAEDSGDNTVRTATAGYDADPTVRASQGDGWKAARAAENPRLVLLRLGLTGAAVLVLIWMTSSAYSAYSKGSELASEIEREQLKNAEDAWKRYEAIRDDVWFPSFLWPARRALKRQLARGAEETINEYRISDTTTVFERHWRSANSNLARALEIDPSDNTVKAELRLTEGHISRIQCSSSAARKDPQIRQRYANAAVQKFMEAAQLRSKWPDPYLGLARLYAEEFADMDRAIEALEKAQKNGHETGNRERLQLAGAHRRIVERHWEESRKMRDLPDQEQQLLNRALSHCSQAGNLYQDLGVFQTAVDQYKALLKRCGDIQQRMDEMQQQPHGIAQ
ncbi:MAG: serine/threonine protein kinase [Bryobacterales bacterium]|nr:serine/threonine protein kinase [Bryobacterales bacterium]